MLFPRKFLFFIFFSGKLPISRMGMNCFSCNRTFNSEAQLWDHAKSVHKDKLKSIPESQWAETLFRHNEIKPEKPLFYRECCGKPFISLKKFKFHKLKFHSEYAGSGIQFKCKVCDKIYNSRTSLKVHIKTEHRIQRPKKASSGNSHMCELCKFTFFFFLNKL